MFKEVKNKINFFDLENSILGFWKNNNIFEKSINQRSDNDKYIFYDGPPFITGTPHYGSLLPSIFKDVIPRYQTMKGKKCERVWGWDCHGLPIESKVEKILNIKNRRDIEKYGIKEFVDECYKYTKNTSIEWKWYIEKIGRWVDFENSYKTMDQNYMESVIWVFKQLYDKGLVYEGVRTSLYCTRCGTPISNFEIAMDNSYADMQDPAVTVCFKILEGKFAGKNILAWTTTPWTLPSNKALVLDPKEEYVLIKVNKLDENIKRVWKVGSMPKEINKGKRVGITQAFIDEQNILYKEDNTYKLNDNEITKEEYIELIKNAQYKIVKQQIQYNLEDGNIAYFDIYQNNLEGLILANVEFSNLKKLNEFKAPEYFEKEITESNILDFSNLAHTNTNEINLQIENLAENKLDYSDRQKEIEVILAKKRMEYILVGLDYIVVDSFKGEELLGAKYEPPFKYFDAKENEHRIYSYKDMVTMEEGTGIVHSAPGFGDIDSEMGRENDLGIAMSIDDEGKYFDIVSDFKGLYVKDADKLIIENLKNRGLLFKHEIITHRYPYCYRCNTPLLQKAQPSWFVDIANQKEQLLRNNENINWVPKYLKHGRFAKGIQTAPDWCVSRTRYWASPMPIWQKVENGNVVERIVVGSRDEIRELSTTPITKVELRTESLNDIKSYTLGGESLDKEFKDIQTHLLNTKQVKFLYELTEEELREAYKDIVVKLKEELNQILEKEKGEHIEIVTSRHNILLLIHIVENKNLKEVFGYKLNKYVMFFNGNELMDLHRPYIDNIKLKGKSGELSKVEEVLDVWLDSASMPYSSRHYPFENKKEFEDNFPADFVVEYIAQTRAWFYVMHVLGNCLFEKQTFNNVVTTGVILGTDGRKMSKSYGNYPDPKDTIEKYGAEALRLYLMGSPVMLGGDIVFDEVILNNQVRDFLLPLWNCYSFFITYANIHNYEPKKDYVDEAYKSNNMLDKWIISNFNNTLKTVIDNFDKYNIVNVVKAYYSFLDDLSKWYIRRSRDRFANNEKECFDTLYYILIEFCKMIAPVTPFITEEIYQNMKVEDCESIHLCDYPKLLDIDLVLLDQMQTVRDIVNLGQSLRIKSGIKVRQPLLEIEVVLEDHEKAEFMKELIEDELNVKNVNFVEQLNSNYLQSDKLNGVMVALNTEINEELRVEGILRELIRAIQGFRKKVGLVFGEKVNIEVYIANNDLKNIIKEQLSFLNNSLSDSNIILTDSETLEGSEKVNINGEDILIRIQK